MRYTVLVIIACYCLLSCATTPTIKEHQIESAIIRNEIRVGSTKKEVSDADIEPLYYGCVKHKRTEEGLLELWDFSTDMCSGYTTNDYALVFKDGVLIEIRKVTSEDDLQLD